MTLEDQWKKIIAKDHKHCYYSELPSNVNPEVFITDITGKLYDLFVPGLKNYSDVLNRFNTYIRSNIIPGLSKIVIVADEARPPNKIEKDTTRDPPLSDQEIYNLGISIPNSDIPSGINPRRILNTSPLRKELIRYLGHNIGVNYMKEFFRPIETKCSLIFDATTDFDYKHSFIEIKEYSNSKDQNKKYENMSFHPSNRIGEGDLKISYHVCNNPGKTIIVHEADGDVLLSLLLLMRDLIDPLTGEFMVDLWLYTKKDLSNLQMLHPKYKQWYQESYKREQDKWKKRNGQMVNNSNDYEENIDNTENNSNDKNKKNQNGEEKKFIHMNELFVSVMNKFKTDFGINHGTIMLCLLTFFTTNDFVKGFNKIGPSTVWDAFKCGHRILTEQKLYKDKEIISNAQLIYEADIDSIGEIHKRHEVWINKNRFLMFTYFLFQYALDKSNSSIQRIFNREQMQKIIKAKQIKKEMDDKKKEAKGKTPRKGNPNKENDGFWHFPSDADLLARIHRMQWIFDYWTNGGRPLTAGERYYYSPVDADQKGNSKWGWKIDPKTRKVVETSMISQE